MRSQILWGALFLLSFLFAQETYEWFPLSKLNHYQGAPRKDIFVEGKLKAFLGQSFELVGVGIAFKIPPKMFRFFNYYTRAGKTNLRVEGDLLYDKVYRVWYFKVKSVILLEEDKSFFEKRLESNQSTVERLYDLAFLAESIAREYHRPEMMEYARRAFLKAVKMELERLPKKEFSRRFQLARILERKYNAKKEAFFLYRQCWEIRPSEELRRKLVELGGILKRGKWYLEEELKKMAGLEEGEQGKWIVQQKHRFLKFLREKQPVPKKQKMVIGRYLVPAKVSPRELVEHYGIFPVEAWRKQKEGHTYLLWKVRIYNPLSQNVEEKYLFFFDQKLVRVEKGE